MRTAIYAGSFDPVTNGHLWVIKQASLLFDQLILAVGVNSQKKYTFNVDKRIDLLQQVTLEYANAKVLSFNNEYLVNYAKEVDARFIIRGIRNSSDYEYEKIMHNINYDLDPTIETIFLMPPRNISEVSSSMIKSLIGSKGWEQVLAKYVPYEVLEEFIYHYEL